MHRHFSRWRCSAIRTPGSASPGHGLPPRRHSWDSSPSQRYSCRTGEGSGPANPHVVQPKLHLDLFSSRDLLPQICWTLLKCSIITKLLLRLLGLSHRQARPPGSDHDGASAALGFSSSLRLPGHIPAHRQSRTLAINRAAGCFHPIFRSRAWPIIWSYATAWPKHIPDVDLPLSVSGPRLPG